MPTLSIDIEARLAKFQDSLDKVGRDGSNVAKQLESSFSGLRTAFQLALGGISVGVVTAEFRRLIDMADDIGDIGAAFGASSAQMQVFSGAARVVGMEMADVAGLFDKFTKQLTDAKTGDPGALQLMRALSITADDLRTKDFGGLLQQALAQIDKFGGSSEKVTLLREAFGKSGRAMDEFAAKATAMGDDLSRLGPKFDPELTEAADKFKTQMALLALNSDRAKVALLGGMLPTMNKLVEEFSKGKEIAGGLFDAVKLFGTINPFRDLAGNLKAAREELERLQAAQARAIGQGRTGTAAAFNPLIDAEQKRLDFLKFQERQAATAKFAGAQFQDARDLRNQQKGAAPQLPDLKTAAGKLAATFDDVLALNAQRRQKQFEDLEEEQGAAAEKRERDRLDFEADLSLAQLSRYEAAEQAADDEIAKNKALADSFLSSIDPTRQLRDELKKIADLEGAGFLTREQSEAAQSKVQALIDAYRGLGSAAGDANDIAKQLGLTFSSAFEGAVLQGKSFRDVLAGIARDIAGIVLRTSVTERGAKAVTKLVGNFDLGSLWDKLTARAEGGPVLAGSPYIVGERGPELFVPRASGTIVPNHAMGGANVSISIDARGAGPGVEQKIESAVRRAVELSLQAVQASADRGGSFARAVGRR